MEIRHCLTLLREKNPTRTIRLGRSSDWNAQKSDTSPVWTSECTRWFYGLSEKKEYEYY